MKDFFEKCETLPDILAVLAKLDDKNFHLTISDEDWQLQQVSPIEIVNIIINSFIGPSEKFNAGGRLPSHLTERIQQILHKGDEEHPVLIGVDLARFMKKNGGLHNTRTRNHRVYWSPAHTPTNEYQKECIHPPTFDQCKTPADIVAVLVSCLHQPTSAELGQEYPTDADFRKIDGRPEYTREEIIALLAAMDDFFEIYQLKLEDKETILKAAFERLKKATEKFPEVYQTIQRIIDEREQQLDSAFPVEPDKLIDLVTHGLLLEMERKETRTQNQERDQEIEVQEAIPVEPPVEETPSSKMHDFFLRRPHYTFLLSLAGLSISVYGQRRELFPDPIASLAVEAGINFEELPQVEELTSEQQEKLQLILEQGDEHYVPFIESLVKASSQGITAEGKLSQDPEELAKSVKQVVERLKEIIADGRVRTYYAPPGTEPYMRSSSSTAKMFTMKKDDPSDDMMLLSREHFWGYNGYRFGTLSHEAGHTLPDTDRETHHITAGLYRSEAKFGEAILETKDFSYYLTALCNVADEIISYQESDAENNEQWSPVTAGEDATAYAQKLAERFMYHNSVLEPFGIDTEELVVAIQEGNLVELGNEFAAEELESNRIEKEKAEQQKNERHRQRLK